MSLARKSVRQLVAWSQRDVHGDAAATKIETVGILGAGMMGTAIAAAHLTRRIPVVLYDIRPEILPNASETIAGELRDSRVFFDKNGMSVAVEDESSSNLPPLAFATEREIKEVAKLIRTTTEMAEAARCDLVVESIAEVLPVKQRLYQQLRDSLPSSSIIVTNTSTIPIRRLAEAAVDASRFCGLHFLHPVRRRPLVEIIRGPATSEYVIATAVAHVKRLGRMPIVVEDGPGFLVNRLLFPFLGEALEMLREGIPAETIELAAREFGMALGPLQLMDEIGLDTTLQAGWVLAAAYPERIVSSPILVSMFKAGRLGQKNGSGFYRYLDGSGDSAGTLDPTVGEVISRWIEPPAKTTIDSRESIAARLLLPMFLEATRILTDREVSDARDIDLAAIFGLGFPIERGGLLWWAEQVGLDRIVAMLASHGAPDERWQPTPLLELHAKTGERLY
jgi:3-hydroxyacyl-CoA dehydrogenase